MPRLSTILSHPSWAGISGILTALSLAATIYTALPPRQPAPSPTPPAPTGNPADPASLINGGLESVNGNYAGMHRYFNDAPYLPYLGAAVGTAMLAGHLWARKRVRQEA